MTGTGIARTAVGVIGNIISGCLFLSPIPTFRKIIKAKSVQEYKPHPYVATLLNCAMWSLYGMPFVNPDDILVLTINGAGFVLQLVYVTIFILYSNWATRKTMLVYISIEAVFFVVVVIITVVALPTHHGRSMLIGLISIVFNIIMYISPLTVMQRVIKTKSVKFMPLALSVASFSNGIIWTIYALLKFDPYLLIPNALGAISGAVQLVLYAWYYRTTDWEEEYERSSIQMSESAP
ncbi:Bidirectional sugar transporter SWEET [Heracleum sosnowskyi]|uniref:Bidirectional sugar transporter SWEET n=1 Tax=Heracleum sosnowskyi TaxID=360622 RepID=A0AAD8M3D8_9APIA|nr:Bidirectional sugar transporter SWEET [Heracleum sosnowskyi]